MLDGHLAFKLKLPTKKIDKQNMYGMAKWPLHKTHTYGLVLQTLCRRWVAPPWCPAGAPPALCSCTWAHGDLLGVCIAQVAFEKNGHMAFDKMALPKWHLKKISGQLAFENLAWPKWPLKIWNGHMAFDKRMWLWGIWNKHTAERSVYIYKTIKLSSKCWVAFTYRFVYTFVWFILSGML